MADEAQLPKIIYAHYEMELDTSDFEDAQKAALDVIVQLYARFPLATLDVLLGMLMVTVNEMRRHGNKPEHIKELVDFLYTDQLRTLSAKDTSDEPKVI